MRTTVASADIGDIILSLLDLLLVFSRASSDMVLVADPLLFELLDLVLELVLLAELLLDRPHLLVEVVLLLRLLHLLLDAERMRFSTSRISISERIS